MRSSEQKLAVESIPWLSLSSPASVAELEFVRPQHPPMIYLVAVVSSLVTCVLSFACEITAGNMTHLRYGREPNAGAALFPTIPFVQFVFVGAAWLVRFLVPSVAFWLFTILCLVLLGLQVAALRRLRAEWKQVSQSRPPPEA